MTALAVHACVPIDQRRVSRDAVCVPSSSQRSCSLSRSDLAPAETGLTVPERHRSELAPTHARLEVVTLSDMRVQQSKDCVRLFLLQANDAARKALVDVQRLFSCDGVTAHERVDAANRLALDRLGSMQLGGALRLLEPGVLDLERLEVLAEGRREALVRLDLVHEQSVTTVFRCVE